MVHKKLNCMWYFYLDVQRTIAENVHSIAPVSYSVSFKRLHILLKVFENE